MYKYYNSTTDEYASIEDYLAIWAEEEEKILPDPTRIRPIDFYYTLDELFEIAKKRSAYLTANAVTEAGSLQGKKLTENEREVFEDALEEVSDHAHIHLSAYSKNYQNPYIFRSFLGSLISSGEITYTSYLQVPAESGYTGADAFKNMKLKIKWDTDKVTVHDITASADYSSYHVLTLNPTVPENPDDLEFEIWDGDCEDEKVIFHVDLLEFADLTMLPVIDNSLKNYLAESALFDTFVMIGLEGLTASVLSRINMLSDRLRSALNKRLKPVRRPLM